MLIQTVCRSFRLSPSLLVATLAMSLASGCFGTMRSGYVDVAYAPANYAAYPSYDYDGARVYYVDGRWYRQDRGRWVYYRHEPAQLYRYRSHRHVAVAPPARRSVNVYRAPAGRRDDHHYRAAPVRESRQYRAAPGDDRRNRSPARGDRRERLREDHRHRRD
jgi:hypothetical protein